MVDSPKDAKDTFLVHFFYLHQITVSHHTEILSPFPYKTMHHIMLLPTEENTAAHEKSITFVIRNKLHFILSAFNKRIHAHAVNTYSDHASFTQQIRYTCQKTILYYFSHENRVLQESSAASPLGRQAK